MLYTLPKTLMMGVKHLTVRRGVLLILLFGVTSIFQAFTNLNEWALPIDMVKIDTFTSNKIANGRSPSTSSSGSIQLCDLPSCDVVRKSRLYSERCSTAKATWPLLITGTPRSATTYMHALLKSHGMQIQNDWKDPLRDGSVSWVFAFEDPDNVGPARTGGRRFRRVLHQVMDPLKSLAAMTNPRWTGEDSAEFILRHVNYSTWLENPRNRCRITLQFWVEWHSYLDKLRLPVYQVEKVHAQDIFRMAKLDHLYKEEPKKAVSKRHNHRGAHRPSFTWQELYTIDPVYAARAWEMAHRYGYTYPNVTFNELTCMDFMPKFEENEPLITPLHCPPGTRPTKTDIDISEMGIVDPLVGVNGVQGWTQSGCVEYKRGDGTFVGLTGVWRKDDLSIIRTDES